MTGKKLIEFRETCNEDYLRDHPGASDAILKENFLKKINEFQASSRKTLVNDAKKLGYNLNKSGLQSKRFGFMYKEVEITMNVLDSNQRQAREKFQEKAAPIIYDGFWNQQKLYEKAIRDHGINDRDTKQFVCGLNSTNFRLQTDSFINAMKGDQLTSKEKNALFGQYIEEAVNEYKNAKVPQNDEEGLQNFGKMYLLGHVFSVDRIDTVYKDLTNEDIDQNTLDYWNANKEEFKNVWRYYGGLLDKLTDPLYPYFTDKEMERVANEFAENEDYTNYIGNPVYFGKNQHLLGFENMLGYGKEIGDMKKKGFEIAKKNLNIDLENDILFTEEGIKTTDIDLEDAVATDKDVFVCNQNGDRFVIGNYKTGFPNVRPVYDVPNSRDVYKHSLDVLNKGTRWYLPSSDEYKNMRNILGKLSRGEGNEVELLKDLKTNMEKYEENYFLKNNKSDIAKERMECVNKIKLGIQTVSDAKNYEAIVNKLVRENQATNTNQTEKVNESEDDYEKYGEEATHDIDGFEIDLDKQPTQKSTEESNRHQMPLNELNEANTIEGSVNNNDIIENVNVNENIIDNNIKNN